jgi:hypothetical protein
MPSVDKMKSWDPQRVLDWIQARYPNILHENDPIRFNIEHICGRAFLRGKYQFFRDCGLSPGASLALEDVADEVNPGKFCPWP